MTEPDRNPETPETEDPAAAEAESGHEIDEDSHSEGERRFGKIQAALAEEDVARLNEVLDPMHSADIADLLEQVSGPERQQILALVPEQIDGEVLSELDENIREEVIETLAPEALAEAVRDLDTDDVVDLVEFLEGDRQEAILDALDASDRVAVQMALTYPEYSAGRLMQREFVVAPGDWTVGHAIDFLRTAEELPEQFYHVILVDPAMRPNAYVTLGRLLASKRDVRLSDITEETFRTIAVDLPEKDVAYAFNQYHLISAPVVDDSGRLVGVITIDDAMIVLEEEAEEDILRLAGVSDESSISDGVVDTVKSRLPWLVVNLATAIVASMVISVFEDSLAELVALAVLMPIIASMGGNAGTQSLTVAVRALATKDLTRSNLMRVIRREGAVGLVHGLAFAVIMGAIEIVWFGNLALAGVIAMAMVINLFIAGLSGILVPVTLERLKLDPALASGTFVTTVTDVVGFFAFLGLATLVLL
ncbi:magnesium transporter [Poseidonocella sp. HB161398]|uniref:magnesium transporter n=1 Tax=Poseidonocella sp. HB161398 TaxID=2320855 RepID=UPI0011093326|nr:magnesium transporter [Poseidonocella sp. HB161398]